MNVISIVAVCTFFVLNTTSCGVKVDKKDNVRLSVGALPYLEVGKIRRMEKRRKRVASKEKNKRKTIIIKKSVK